MTDKVNPSINRPANPFKTAGAIHYSTNLGWISPSASSTEIAVQDDDIDETALNEFAETSSTSSFNVTIDPGEAFVFGSWLAIDTSTTVTLASSTNNQTVYLGWNKNGSDDVIIGLSSAFDSASENTDQKIPLFEFDTDGSGVTNVTDRRVIGQKQGSTEIEGDLTVSDVLTVNSDATLPTGSDINGNNIFHEGNDGPNSGLDADTLQGSDVSALKPRQFFGDGSDGSVTRSSNTTETQVVNATDYTVESGVTVSVDTVLFVYATNSITINGEINATGAGASGGSPSSDGGAGSFSPLQEGGSGGIQGDNGFASGSNGGDGGDGDIREPNLKVVDLAASDPSLITSRVFENANAGAGGGGGANGGGTASDTGNDSAGDGQFPGGGGGGGVADNNSSTRGGTGGNGGGLVVLAAPSVDISGTVVSNGEDGEDAENGTGGGGGGGGGGSSGLIFVYGNTVTGANNLTTSGGIGGSGASATANGGDGADGTSVAPIVVESTKT